MDYSTKSLDFIRDMTMQLCGINAISEIVECMLAHALVYPGDVRRGSERAPAPALGAQREIGSQRGIKGAL